MFHFDQIRNARRHARAVGSIRIRATQRPAHNGGTHDRLNAVTLTADALGRGSGTVADDMVAYVKSNPLPQGVHMAWA